MTYGRNHGNGPPECSSLASQLDYGQSNLESPARPMLNITQDEITDTDTDQSQLYVTFW